MQTAELEAIELVKKKTLEKRRIKKSPRLLVKEQAKPSAVPPPAIAYGPDLPD